MNALRPPTSARRGCLLLLAIPWTLFACFWTGAALLGAVAMVRENEFTIWTLAFPLFGLPFIAIGAGMLWYGIVPWIAGLRVTKPEVTIDNTSVRVGDSFTVGYSQTFKHRTEVKGVKFSLLLRETARYQSGSTTTTIRHDETAAEFEYPGQSYEAGSVLAFSRSMEIPRSGMHSFQAVHNSIAWLLQVKVDIPGWPDYREEFEIQVQPILAR
jgi:hypothetical protein